LTMPALVDAHVHFHSSFEVEPFLDAASRNLARAQRKLKLAEAACVLLFADPQGWNSFREIRERIRGGRTSWSLGETGEETSLIARRDGDPQLILIRGSQVVTRERLEILLLASSTKVRDGTPFEEAVDRALKFEAITVLPWGLGKWFGGRGRLVRTAMESPAARNLFVGDNGGRLARTPTPALIRRGIRKGVWNLPGSDPLPFPSQQARVGSRGFVLPGDLDHRRPSSEVRRLVGELEAQPVTFGRGMGVVEFVAAQVRMQLHQRTRGG